MSVGEKELFLLEAWVADNPGSRLFTRLAEAYRRQGRLQEAVEVLERGLVLRPQEVGARQLLAAILRQLGESARAEAQLQEAARQLVAHAGVFQDLAELWESQGRSEEAARARRVAQALRQEIPLVPAPERPAAAAPPPPPPAAVRAAGSARVLARLEAWHRAALRRAAG